MDKTESNPTWKPTYMPFDTFNDYIADYLSLDHSYFEKTSSGFKLSPDKSIPYINNQLKQAIGSSGLTVTSAEADYLVVDGRLDTVTINVTISGVVSGMNMTISITGSEKYFDYGTTSVTVPSDVRNIANDYVK